LHERDGAALWGSHFPVLSRTPPEFGKEGTQEGAKDLARESRVVGTAITKRVWKREHPLADRDFGQNAVDEVRRRLPAKQSFACIAVATLPLGHAVAAATWAKAPAFAREGDEAVEAAIVAVQAQEAMGEDAAAQEGMELLFDEAGHGLLASLCACQEGLEFLPDDVVEDALFGAMSCVGALRTSALRVGRMGSMDRLGDLLKDHPCEPLPGTCRPAGASNARESALPGKFETTRSR
jgi:hypothetical protein